MGELPSQVCSTCGLFVIWCIVAASDHDHSSLPPFFCFVLKKEMKLYVYAAHHESPATP